MRTSSRTPQYPGRKFEATLVTTSNAVDVASRSIRVELQADNTDDALFGGAYCKVAFQLPGNANNMRVPATALISSDRGSQVAILAPDGKAVFRQVQLGRDFGDSVEVTSGLTLHDKVIDSPPET